MSEIPQILDATAGNRSIWHTKEDPRVLFIDIEPELDVPPDMVLDCTKTGFPDESFHTIFFDPPHDVGSERGTSFNSSPSRKFFKPHWRDRLPCYYGTDKFKTKTELMVFIYKAAKEMHRILKEDGCLWFKWGEKRADVDAVLSLFKDFMIMMVIPIKQSGQWGRGSYWVMLMKKQETRE